MDITSLWKFITIREQSSETSTLQKGAKFQYMDQSGSESDQLYIFYHRAARLHCKAVPQTTPQISVQLTSYLEKKKKLNSLLLPVKKSYY
jgi:hypothetical protein